MLPAGREESGISQVGFSFVKVQIVDEVSVEASMLLVCSLAGQTAMGVSSRMWSRCSPLLVLILGAP